MGIGLSGEEQDAAELARQKGLAEERIARRERLNHQAMPEPVLDEE